jgi:ribosome maturation factor RimP
MLDETGLARLEEVIQPVLRGHGVELVDLDWRGSRPRGTLKLFVDKPGGVKVEDCERVSRELGDVLEVAGLIEGGYDLEVSSPGLDRILRKEREFRWAVGRAVRCWTAGGREFFGRLVEVRPEMLRLEHGGQSIEVPRAQLTKARLEAEVAWARRS